MELELVLRRIARVLRSLGAEDRRSRTTVPPIQIGPRRATPSAWCSSPAPRPPPPAALAQHDRDRELGGEGREHDDGRDDTVAIAAGEARATNTTVAISSDARPKIAVQVERRAAAPCVARAPGAALDQPRRRSGSRSMPAGARADVAEARAIPASSTNGRARDHEHDVEVAREQPGARLEPPAAPSPPPGSEAMHAGVVAWARASMDGGEADAVDQQAGRPAADRRHGRFTPRTLSGHPARGASQP